MKFEMALLLLLALLQHQSNAISCECHAIPPPQAGVPGKMILKCDGQKTSGDCRCYLHLPQAPVWTSDGAGICFLNHSDDKLFYQITGWKCAEGEDHQVCSFDYIMPGQKDIIQSMV